MNEIARLRIFFAPAMQSIRATTVTLTIILLTGVVIWYGWFEPPYLSYRGLPFQAVGDAQAGTAVELHVTRCSNATDEQVYLISRRLIRIDTPPRDDTPPVILATAPVSIDPGCHDEISAANLIPLSTRPGRYYLRGQAKVDGHWRNVYVPWQSGPFNVLPPSPRP